VDAEEFARGQNVPRGTILKLQLYHELLTKWGSRINLVSRSSLAAAWRRHFLDSAQLFPLAQAHARGRPITVVDLGSGAGFPGLVLAIMAAELDWTIHLVESDLRKAAFLAEVAGATQVTAHTRIRIARAESLAAGGDLKADIVTARALAPLPQLLDLAAPFLKPDGICLFLKGAKVESELTALTKTWKMRLDRLTSRADPTGTVLRIADLSRAR
jgi:16S rRNA (guanine527-N7)-methyltransferase